MVVTQAAATVADRPDAGRILLDRDLGRSAQELFVQGVGNDLADSVGIVPRLKNTFDVEVE